MSRKSSKAKKLYKARVRSKLEEDNIKYRLTRRHCKRVVKEAREESKKNMESKLVSWSGIHHTTSTRL